MVDVPLAVGTHIVGVIRIYLLQPRNFSEEELNFAISITPNNVHVPSIKPGFLKTKKRNTIISPFKLKKYLLGVERLPGLRIRLAIPWAEFCLTVRT